MDIKKIVRTRLPEDEGGDWTEDVEEYPKVFIGEVGDPALQYIQKKGSGCLVCVTSHAATFLMSSMACLQVPIMLRSNYCSLADRSEKELADLGECPYDQVRWRCPCRCAHHPADSQMRCAWQHPWCAVQCQTAQAERYFCV